ncbi:MAG: tellurite resistance/C4-dicarboxylate transporter family protein, partial [Candidatus Saccharimonadales bacterium]
PVLFYRYVFFRVRPSDLQPVFWVNMGAMSISALAGSSLLSQVTGAEFVQDVLPVLRGLVLLYWAAATWWIPMLVVLGVWRHVVERFPLTYSPMYWGMVFPLGMYTVATHQVARTIGVEWLRPVPKVCFAVALVTWIAVFAGMVISLARQAIEGFRNMARHSRAPRPRAG